jgi:hypothetical protein
MALAAVLAADRFRIYLGAGGLENAGIALAVVAVAPVAALFVWWSTTTAALSEPRSSMTRFVMDVGPFVFLVALGLAWSLGILGWLGVGPIRPGLLTFIGTGLVIGTSVLASRHVRRVLPWSWPSAPKG